MTDPINDVAVLADTRRRLVESKDGISSYDKTIKAIDAAIARAAAAAYPTIVVNAEGDKEDDIPF